MDGLGGRVKFHHDCRKKGLRLISSLPLLCLPLSSTALERGNKIPESDGVPVSVF